MKTVWPAGYLQRYLQENVYFGDRLGDNTALPDKAYRPIQPSISKSPNIFASGGTATLSTAPTFD
ncbi:hypothetical protein G3N62_13780 [Burkholderia sp. Tr-20355]|uniref:hypothetical protein n=1 Tax=Burkholderia seminalis TaxID=488731 RepID=UPI000F5AFF72|nr:hypothetical protein [Burkholderia seminalis]MBN3739626.1 hypothetical protein [Burkholderia sp. Tr-20355]